MASNPGSTPGRVSNSIPGPPDGSRWSRRNAAACCPMRTVAEARVVAWLDREPAESVWITSITLFETRLGLALLPTGRRRQTLETAFARLLKEDLENRVLDFDSAAAAEATSLAAARQKAGRLVDMRDTQIVRIALARRATLAARNGPVAFASDA